MGSVVISGATSGAVTLAVPDEAGTRTLTLPATTGTILTNDISQAGDTSAGNAAAVGYTAAEGLILTGQGSTSDVTIKNDADATVLSIPTGTTNVGIGTTSASKELELGALDVFRMQTGSVTMDCTPTAGATDSFVWNTSVDAIYRWDMNGTERMRIDSSGNVGIGTTSPTTQLTLRNNTSAIAPIVTLLNDSFIGSEGAAIDFTYAQTQPVGARISSENDGNFAADLVFSTKTSGATGNALSERMRIDSSGRVLINSTSIIASDTAPLQATGGSVTAVALKGGTNNYFMAFYNTSNTLIGSITGSTGSTTAFNTSSDYRLKENVSYTFDATTRLKQLKPARFNFKVDAGKTVDGFLAHEVQEVVPEAVTGEKDGEEMQGIDHSKLVPLLTASLQELSLIHICLEEQVNALKGK